jgi:hypothetical protein
MEIYAIQDDPATAACTKSFLGGLTGGEILPASDAEDGP